MTTFISLFFKSIKFIFILLYTAKLEIIKKKIDNQDHLALLLILNCERIISYHGNKFNLVSIEHLAAVGFQGDSVTQFSQDYNVPLLLYVCQCCNFISLFLFLFSPFFLFFCIFYDTCAYYIYHDT